MVPGQVVVHLKLDQSAAPLYFPVIGAGIARRFMATEAPRLQNSCENTQQGFSPEMPVFESVEHNPSKAKLAKIWSLREHVKSAEPATVEVDWSLTQGLADVTVAVLDGGILCSPWYPDLADRLTHFTDDRSQIAGTIAALTSNKLGISGLHWNARSLPASDARHTPVLDSSRLEDAGLWWMPKP